MGENFGGRRVRTDQIEKGYRHYFHSRGSWGGVERRTRNWAGHGRVMKKNQGVRKPGFGGGGREEKGGTLKKWWG